MAKAGRKVYAVRVGREGPQVYSTWEETKRNVARFPGAIHKSFPASQMKEAEEWIKGAPSQQKPYFRPQAPDRQPLAVKREYSSPGLEQEEDSAPVGGLKTEPMDLDFPPDHEYDTDSDFENEPPLDFPLGAAPAPAVPPAAAAPEQKIQLSEEQKAVLERVKRGENVFFTGSAGTGKSVLLREIIRTCREDGRPGRLAVTASTGIASVNIGGTTLHSWAGIGLGKETADKLVGKLLGQDKWQRMKEAAKRREQGQYDDDETEYGGHYSNEREPRTVEKWRQTRTLIIDEISMIDGVLFDKLEFIARAIRDNQAPFGGIQLVLSGDFCQLPPVPDYDRGAPQPVTFAFDAKSWGKCIMRPVFLTKVFRQKDQGFVDMLNAMRFGHLEPETVQKFKDLSRAVRYDDGIEPTDLFPTRREVDACNSKRLGALKEKTERYEAMDMPGHDDQGRPIPWNIVERLVERLIAPKVIDLKVGAQVMLIKNQPQGFLVNGSVGRIEKFSTARDAVNCGTQIAISDSGQKNKGNYKGRQGGPQVPDEILRNNRVWPLVKFQNGSSMLCIPQMFEVNNANGRVEATRAQVPLILAWALSIHKSQGQTLERVRVNLGRAFEKGQAYVALSRATNMDTLQVIAFDPAKVMAHPRVLEWHSQETGEQFADSDVDDDDFMWADL